MTHPLMLLVRGLPGSGKSSLAEMLSSMLADVSVCLLDPDHVDTESGDYRAASERMATGGVPVEVHIYRYLCECALRATTENDLTIWTQAFTSRSVFRSLLCTIGRFPRRPNVVVVELLIDPALAFHRVTMRTAAGGRDVPKGRFDQFVEDYESYVDLGLPTIRLDSAELCHATAIELAESIKGMMTPSLQSRSRADRSSI